MVESIPSIHSRSRRRHEFVQEEVRKTMINYMTSIKGEITDIVLDEMIDYYNSQTLKLYHLEKELIHIKNSSLPMINNNNTLLNDLIIHMTKQQHLFAFNISLMENKIKNLTNILNELKQQKPIQHVRRFISVNNNNKIPIGKLYFISQFQFLC
jgi:hypothetical protein